MQRCRSNMAFNRSCAGYARAHRALAYAIRKGTAARARQGPTRVRVAAGDDPAVEAAGKPGLARRRDLGGGRCGTRAHKQAHTHTRARTRTGRRGSAAGAAVHVEGESILDGNMALSDGGAVYVQARTALRQPPPLSARVIRSHACRLDGRERPEGKHMYTACARALGSRVCVAGGDAPFGQRDSLFEQCGCGRRCGR